MPPPPLLEQAIGPAAGLIFLVALLASGQSSTMTGTLAGQYVIEGYFDVPLSPLLRGLISRAAAIAPAAIVAAVYGADGAESLVQVASVITSFMLPFALIPLLKFTTSLKVMGEHMVASRPMAIMLWGLTLLIVGANTALGVLQLRELGTIDSSPAGVAQGVFVGVGSLLYFAALLALLLRPVSWDGKVTAKAAAVTPAALVVVGGADAAVGAPPVVGVRPLGTLAKGGLDDVEGSAAATLTPPPPAEPIGR